MHGARLPLLFLAAVVTVTLATGACPNSREAATEPMNMTINLPEPRLDGDVSVEKAIEERRSIRSYTEGPLSLTDVSQLLWSAQGITDEARNFRAAPSAGATYPLELYAVAGEVDDLEPGVYKYNPADNELVGVLEGDVRRDIYEAALRQDPVRDAPVVLVFTAVYERTTGRYGERGIRFVHMEIGHAAQNVYLQAGALGLGTVVIGAFDEDATARIMGLPEEEKALYLIPVGRM